MVDNQPMRAPSCVSTNFRAFRETALLQHGLSRVQAFWGEHLGECRATETKSPVNRLGFEDRQRFAADDRSLRVRGYGDGCSADVWVGGEPDPYGA
jgi:hypothetical protein